MEFLFSSYKTIITLAKYIEISPLKKSYLMTSIHVVCFGLRVLSHVVCICNMYVHCMYLDPSLSVIIYKLMLHVTIL